MTRLRYIQDRETGELIPAEQYQRQRIDAPMIMPDISPYRNIIDGTEITSRSKHREFLARNGVREVGNEAPSWMREKMYEDRHK